jgi:hypothetical protein
MNRRRREEPDCQIVNYIAKQLERGQSLFSFGRLLIALNSCILIYGWREGHQKERCIAY